MKATSQRFSTRVLNLFDLFYQNGSRTCRGPRTSVDRLIVWSILYIQKELNQYWNVKWTMKHSLYDWDHIIKLIIIIAFYMQCIYFVSVKDGDATRKIKLHKCSHLWIRRAGITSLYFFVWSLGMSKLLKSEALGLPETENQRERTFDENVM